jgi:hypothetical protein
VEHRYGKGGVGDAAPRADEMEVVRPEWQGAGVRPTVPVIALRAARPQRDLAHAGDRAVRADDLEDERIEVGGIRPAQPNAIPEAVAVGRERP